MQGTKVSYNSTFNTPHGKEVLEDILTFCHVFEPPTIPEDPNVLGFMAGRRDAAMYILQQLGIQNADLVSGLLGDG